eukprot:scaffold259860_cov36-Tisochrysis_lutea.AAC.1
MIAAFAAPPSYAAHNEADREADRVNDGVARQLRWSWSLHRSSGRATKTGRGSGQTWQGQGDGHQGEEEDLPLILPYCCMTRSVLNKSVLRLCLVNRSHGLVTRCYGCFSHVSHHFKCT